MGIEHDAPGWAGLQHELAARIDALSRVSGVALELADSVQRNGLMVTEVTIPIDAPASVRDEAERLAVDAEDRSAAVCYRCGAAGRMRGGDWLYVACDEHTRRGD